MDPDPHSVCTIMQSGVRAPHSLFYLSFRYVGAIFFSTRYTNNLICSVRFKRQVPYRIGTHLKLSLSDCVSPVSVSMSLSIFLSLTRCFFSLFYHCLSVSFSDSLSLCLFISLPLFLLSLSLSVSFYLFVCVLVLCLTVSLSVCAGICLSNLSVCLLSQSPCLFKSFSHCPVFFSFYHCLSVSFFLFFVSLSLYLISFVSQYLCIFLTFCLSVSICQSFVSLSLCQSVSVCLSFPHCLPVCLPFQMQKEPHRNGFPVVKMIATPLKVHKIEIFFGFDFEICIISLLVMSKY